jgi:nucleotide-binding universal stress UspA family protein
VVLRSIRPASSMRVTTNIASGATPLREGRARIRLTNMRETHLNEPPLRARAIDPAAEERRASTRPSVDEMSEWSFPASDPPATWTWDVERPARGLPVAGPASRTVVVGYDGSPPSQRSLERAATFVGASGRLILVTASPSSVSQGLMSEPLLDAPTSDEQSALLERGRTLLEPRGIEPILVATASNPAEALVEAARIHGGDLIVLGHTGSGYVTRALLGSTAENVLRHAPCDVLVVR